MIVAHIISLNKFAAWSKTKEDIYATEFRFKTFVKAVHCVAVQPVTIGNKGNDTTVLFVQSVRSQMRKIGTELFAVHFRSVCPTKTMDGAKNSTNPLPPVSFSAIFRDVNVLPVPQAMISLPRSPV